MPLLEHTQDNLKQLAERAWAVLKNGDMKKNEVAETMKAHGLTSDLRVDAIQYQLVHLHNLCVSLILIKDNLLHFSWWDSHFPGIPTNEWKIENTSTRSAPRPGRWLSSTTRVRVEPAQAIDIE
ncbi:MAG: hypothetical protein Q8K18_18755 [Burkholderiales bacterium]|nr:hypothetical protein [Burkholderiales bacterium]